MNSSQFENTLDVVTLREKAAAKLAHNPVPLESTRSVEEILHELHVHQIELEMQNEELRRAQVALETSRDHYANLYEFSPNAYLTLSRAGLISEINLAGTQLLGAERKKILNRRFARYVTPEYSDRWYLHFRNVLKSAENLSCEFALKRADGSILHVYADTQCQQIDGAVILRISLTDISGRKQLEQQLKLKEFALDHAGEAIFLIDATQRYIYANEKACRTLGYSRDELLKLTPSDISPGDTPEIIMNLRMRALTGETVMYETFFRRRDGSSFPVELQISEFNYQGQTICMALVRDISERKRYEEERIATKIILEEQNMRLHAYRQSLAQRVEQGTAELNVNHQLLQNEALERQQVEERLSVMASNVPGFIYTVRVDANGHTSFPYASPGVENLFGVSPAEMRRDAGVLRARYHPDDLPHLLDLMVETERTLGAFHIEMRILDRDNCYVWVEIRSIPKRLPDGGTEWHGIISDIGVRKQAESDLAKSHIQLRGLLIRREQVREEERKRISREIHDELGQILTTLQLKVSSSVRECVKDAPLLREHLQESVALANKAMNSVRNVAAVLRPVELDAGISSALRLQAKRFSVVTGVQSKCTVDVDENRINEDSAVALYRIVQESLTNIAKYAKADSVDISLKNIAGEYILKIQDNGIGFDTNERKVNSFGLIGIQERSLMLGGAAHIVSKVGSGTEITVCIPERNNHD